MLINIRVSELLSNTGNSIPLSILTIIALFVPLNDLLPINNNIFTNEEKVYYVSSNNWDGTISHISDITSIGNTMYSLVAMWLIVTSLILLLAMVGSIIITGRKENNQIHNEFNDK
jgi:NADH-ubiquinone oxidoreductase chain 6